MVPVLQPLSGNLLICQVKKLKPSHKEKSIPKTPDKTLMPGTLYQLLILVRFARLIGLVARVLLASPVLLSFLVTFVALEPSPMTTFHSPTRSRCRLDALSWRKRSSGAFSPAGLACGLLLSGKAIYPLVVPPPLLRQTASRGCRASPTVRQRG